MVPELRHRHVGKTIPPEKFAIARSLKYFEEEKKLTLPALVNSIKFNQNNQLLFNLGTILYLEYIWMFWRESRNYKSLA